MAYSSIVFIFYFLPVFLALYYLLPKIPAKNIVLFIFSLGFYFWGGGKLIVLLLAVALLAWVFSLLIAKTDFKKGFLIIAILVFAGILVYNKYLGFIIDNLIYAGITGLPAMKSVTTLGVSFFTFQAISYNVDVYRKNHRFEKNPFNIILYLTMFPQLISGPLVRYQQLGPQLKGRTFNLTLFSEGVRRFIMGLGKKVLIADQLGHLVGQVVDNEMIHIRPELAWATMAIFALQIFFDFSGYTDMAIGAGKMMGFDLPENFNYPYVSRSISDFWRRWHMTFANWIRDYIFTPLAFQMRYWGKAGIFIALMVTFMVCGMWHGPTWNYLIWGVIQGLFLGLEELFLLKFLKKLKGFAILYSLFIIITCLAFFRMEHFSQAIHYLSVMFSPATEGALGIINFFTWEHGVIIFFAVLLCIPIKWPVRWQRIKNFDLKSTVTTVVLLLVFLLSVMRLVTATYNPFIYFKF